MADTTNGHNGWILVFLLLGVFIKGGKKERAASSLNKDSITKRLFSLFLGLALPVERLDDRNEKDHRVVKEQIQRSGRNDCDWGCMLFA